jgi:YegS/Rv2252/BmrU family lipid kinase
VQTCIIFNPSARGERADVLCARVETLFPNCVWRRTNEAGHARGLAAQAVRDGFQTIIAAGGDGTANEVVNGIGDVSGGFDSTHFGVLPLGTVNVFARELGLPRDLPGAVKVLKEGKTMTIDLGRAEYTAAGSPQQRFFIQLAGAGLDSRSIELVNWELKKKLGPLAYLVAGCQAMRETQPLIVVRGETPASGQMVLIGNGRFYGGSFAVFPAASLQDGLLDVCVLPKVTWPRLLAAAPGLLTGRLFELCSALHFSLPSVTLTSASRVILQLDGENACELPATLSIRPKALRVIVP